MRVMLLGLSHQTAPVALREKLTLTGERLQAAFTLFQATHPGCELVILSTCNRTELYVARPAHAPPTAAMLRAFLCEISQATLDEIESATHAKENEAAITHLFRVTGGLDSMVLGEPQILGQVRRAYEAACTWASVGPVLHKLFQQALATGKQVRSETGIGAGRLSIGSVAVDFARQIFDTFEDKTVLGIGAGEMAKLALRHLLALGPSHLWLVNRTPERAAQLASQLGLDQHLPGSAPGLSPGFAPGPMDASLPARGRGSVRAYEELDDLLIEADIVLASTAAPHPILTLDRFKPLLRKRKGRPLFLIDIALPRNIDPAIGSLGNVYLYNLDDLQGVVARTRQDRSGEIAAAEEILQAQGRACLAEIQNRDIGQLIRALRDRLHTLGQAEHRRTCSKAATLTPEALHAALPAMMEEQTHRLINKILHLPLSQLDRREAGTSLGFYAAALRRLFDLEATETPPAAADEAPGPPAVPGPGRSESSGPSGAIED